MRECARRFEQARMIVCNREQTMRMKIQERTDQMEKREPRPRGGAVEGSPKLNPWLRKDPVTKRVKVRAPPEARAAGGSWTTLVDGRPSPMLLPLTATLMAAAPVGLPQRGFGPPQAASDVQRRKKLLAEKFRREFGGPPPRSASALA
mmetsp:Transcript_11080/g.36449  ORF Transcript_11080/g.36449 Transcript_11080/m.36449 type:complete len:148 (-) Transcript_11080:47-490(-)